MTADDRLVVGAAALFGRAVLEPVVGEVVEAPVALHGAPETSSDLVGLQLLLPKLALCLFVRLEDGRAPRAFVVEPSDAPLFPERRRSCRGGHAASLRWARGRVSYSRKPWFCRKLPNRWPRR